MAEKGKQSPGKRTSYLERLTIDPGLLTGFVGKYITNIRLVLLLAITIALLGIVAYTQLPRRLNPEVEIPIVTVVTVLPGAGPSDVESLVTIPIEDKLRSLKGIDTVSSSSRDNVSVITLQFQSSVDRTTAKNEVQSAVDSVSGLPTDAQTPTVTALDFEDQPVWTFAFVTSKSYPDLMRTAQALRDRMEELPKIDRVETSGFDSQEIVVEVDQTKLANYGINPFELSTLLKRARGSLPAGVVSTGRNSYSLTIDPSVHTIEDIRELRISSQGKVVSLSDIATVVLRSKVGQQHSYVATPDTKPQQAVTFYVYKTVGTNIDAAGKEVEEAVDAFMEESGNGYQLITLSNIGEEITEQFTDLLGEFRTTILLVMGVLLLFLGLRQSLISSLTVPLTFLSAFFFMQITGMSINFLSMFAFLLALGLLVDDTIVVVSAMTTYFKTGRFSPAQTGALVWRDTIVPIWSTTLTTIWSFVPLLITSGIIGEFIKPIPVVVTVTMISSTAIAVLITLPLMVVLLKPQLPKRVLTLLKVFGWVACLGVLFVFLNTSMLFPLILLTYIVFTLIAVRLGPIVARRIQTMNVLRTQTKRVERLKHCITHGIINVESFSAAYNRLILRILQDKSSRRKVIIATVVYSIVCFSLLPLGFVKNEFFPKVDANEIFVELELPAGTTLERTTAEALSVLRSLRDTEELEYVTAEIGRGGSNGFGAGAFGSNRALFSLRLTDFKERGIASYTIAENLRKEFATYANGDISVQEQSGGPPAGSDLQLTLLGDDLGELNEYADTVVSFLEAQKGVTNVDKSIVEGTSKLVFVPDPTKLTEHGITLDTIGFTLRTFASGFTLDSITLNEGDKEKTDIVLRMQKGTADVLDLSSLTLMSPRGQVVPLMALGTLEPKVSPTSISREDFKRSITVSAAVRPGFSIPEQNKKLDEFSKTINFAEGYEWKTGGVNEENAKSIQSILQAMVLSAVLIMITMVVQFKSFRQAAIVLIVIPLAVSSVFLAFALTGTALSFPALIGVLSLFGIVVTNSMFIVDKINLNQREGMEFKEAIADAGASRMEPIILTKLSTVFGLLPITIADPLWRGLGGAIISGLLVASAIMLLFIPVLYYSWMKPERLVKE